MPAGEGRALDAFSLIIKLSTQLVTAEGYEELTQDIVVLKSQVYSQAEIFNFTMKRIQEVKEVVEEVKEVEEV